MPPMFKRLMASHGMRRRVSWIIAAVLVLPFLFFFHATTFQPPAGPGGTAGVLFGKPIPWDVFERYYRLSASRLESQYGELPEALRPLIIQSTWDWLLLLAEAKRQRLRVSDTDLRAVIQQEPAFQDGGRFQRQHYEALLARNGMTSQAFEQQMREQLLVQRLIDRFLASVTVSEEDVRAAYRLRHERLTAALWLFDPQAFRRQAADGVTKETVRQHYDAHPEAVRVPERLRIEYAGADRTALASKVQLTDQELAAFYDERRAAFAAADGTIPALADVREDLRTQLTAQRVDRQLAALALDLEDDLEAQRPFEEIVTSRALIRRTTDPIALEELPAPDGLDPAIASAAAELPEGRLSRVIQASGGVYLARVTQRIPARLPPFEEVEREVRAHLIEARAGDAARQAAEALAASLAEAKPVPAPREVTFTRSEAIDPLGTVPEVNAAAFAVPLGTLTDVLATPAGYVLLRPQTLSPADETGFAAEADAVRDMTLEAARAARWREWLRDLRQQAQLQSFVDGVPAVERDVTSRTTGR